MNPVKDTTKKYEQLNEDQIKLKLNEIMISLHEQKQQLQNYYNYHIAILNEQINKKNTTIAHLKESLFQNDKICSNLYSENQKLENDIQKLKEKFCRLKGMMRKNSTMLEGLLFYSKKAKNDKLLDKYYDIMKDAKKKNLIERVQKCISKSQQKCNQNNNELKFSKYDLTRTSEVNDLSLTNTSFKQYQYQYKSSKSKKWENQLIYPNILDSYSGTKIKQLSRNKEKSSQFIQLQNPTKNFNTINVFLPQKRIIYTANKLNKDN